MEGEERSGMGGSGKVKKGVSFMGVDEAPKPPPRVRKRASRSKKGGNEESVSPGYLTPDSQDSDVEVIYSGSEINY